MDLDDLATTISDLVQVEPRSFGSDSAAQEASAWLAFTKKTEADAEELLGPGIKKAFDAHKALTTAKKKLLDGLSKAKDRVRVNLANWIAGGHDVTGCYIQRKWKVTVTDDAKLPAEFWMTVPDQAKLDEWTKTTEGKVAISGCTIEQTNILFSRDKE